MRITTRGRYALRASLALAQLSSQGSPVSISTLAAGENVSAVFLEQIFFRLKKAGIVASSRGPGGGFCFAQPLEKLTVGQILEAAGEDLDLAFCDKHKDECERLGECMSHHVWEDVNELVKNYFADISLSSILEKYDRAVSQEAEKHE